MGLPEGKDIIRLDRFVGRGFSDALWLGLPWWQFNDSNKRAFAEARAHNIEDNSGIPVSSIKEYQAQNGGRGILKGLAIGTLTAIATGSAALLFPPLVPAATLIGFSTGVIAGTLSIVLHASNVVKDYNMYLDEKAAEARAIKGSMSREACIDPVDHGLGKQFMHKSQGRSL